MKTTKRAMKSLTQQIATGLSLALVVTAIAVSIPHQALANGKGRKSAPAKIQPRNNPPPSSHSGGKRTHVTDFPVNDYDPQRNVAGKGVRQPTENFSLNSKGVKSSQPGGEQTRPGTTTTGKYGPKKPLGVWVWVESEKSYVWM